ncbi:hypothetical protein [Cupriavidus sp. SW-Y-13]|uniref:hypothetical protein n=1 Tax=Cupriavidus sp. SW-Y-13 TaxID=2653854 RepID=UPI00136583E1|nr:hypothetical protein [Cupriavidus sp. SW-Y-13]MWL91006.1 hypothetical protein [Cupriavidus sp. SW-Y-13]
MTIEEHNALCPYPYDMFEFLKPLVRIPSSTLRLGLFENGFFPVNNDLIFEAEKKLGYAFPNELRTFYVGIGEGRLQSGEEARFFSHSHNSVIHPTDIPKLFDGTCEWMMPYTEIQPDVLPFFDRDLDLF